MPLPHSNIICVTVKELVSVGVSENYLKKALNQQRNNVISCWPHHKDGRTVLLHYDGLLPKYQQLIKEKLCDGFEPTEWLKNKKQIEKAEKAEELTDRLELTILTALDNYAPYLKHYDGFTKEQAKKAAQTCAAYVACFNYMVSNGIRANALTFYKEVGEMLDKHGLKPKNARRVQDKIQPIHEETPVHEIVTVPRAGNNNRSLYREADAATLDTIKGWMLQLMDGHNYTDAMIVRTVLQNCMIQQFEKIPSKSTLQNWVNARDISFLSANDRYGDNNRFSRKYNGITPMERPLFANDVWQMDGTRINMIPHKAVAKNGKKKDTFLYIITTYDAHSGDILGEWFGYTESRWAYVAALHSACMNTGALPNTLVIDRFPGHKTQEWQNLVKTLTDRYGVKVIYTSKATGKAQVERNFGTLQSVFMAKSNLYYGEGIKSSRPSAHRTEHYLKGAIKEAKANGYDFEKAINEAFKVVQAYRQTPLCEYSRKYAKIEHTPAQLFELSDKPKQIALEPVDMIRLFWLKRKLTLSQQMFKMEVLREDCYYMFDQKSDYEFIKNNTGKEFEIRYDAFDLNTIHIFEIETGQHIRQVSRWTKPIGYGADADQKKVAKRRNAINAIEMARKAEKSRMIEEAIEIVPPSLPEPQQEQLADLSELTSLTPHEPKGIKENAESALLLNNMGIEPEKDAWEQDAESIQIPGLDN